MKFFSEAHKQNISKACMGRIPWNKGLTKETDERVAKQSKSQKGLLNNPFPSGDLNPAKRLDVKIKIGKARQGKSNPGHSQWMKENNPMKRLDVRTKRSGANNHWWAGGVSFEPYGHEFNKALKEQIRKRDNYTCRECGFTQEQLKYKLPVHHIDYNKKNNLESNLISLCRGCHQKTGFDRGNWTHYYREKMLGEEICGLDILR